MASVKTAISLLGKSLYTSKNRYMSIHTNMCIPTNLIVAIVLFCYLGCLIVVLCGPNTFL